MVMTGLGGATSGATGSAGGDAGGGAGGGAGGSIGEGRGKWRRSERDGGGADSSIERDGHDRRAEHDHTRMVDFLTDRSWMYSIPNRHHSERFQSGVKKFIEFASENSKGNLAGVFPCPCKNCSNRYNRKPDKVFQHVVVKGFTPDYYEWVHHGELLGGWKGKDTYEGENDDIHGLLRDIRGDHDHDDYLSDQTNDERDAGCSEEEPVNKDADKFYRLLKDADEPLYDGCDKYNKLSFVVKLLHFKVLFGWSNKSFTELLLLFKDVLPCGSESLPSSYYEAKFVVEELGLDYKKIDACPNDCMLFWKDSEDKEKCDHCNASRYATNDANDNKRKKVAE